MNAGIRRACKILSGCLIVFLSLISLGFIWFIVDSIYIMHTPRPKIQSELYGTYVADYNVAKEKLTLNEDGTFIQEVTLKETSQVYRSQGNWTYNPSSSCVEFHTNFMDVLDDFGRIRPNYEYLKLGSNSYPASNYFGYMQFGWDEKGIMYKRVG
jgi:hypothetical protein